MDQASMVPSLFNNLVRYYSSSDVDHVTRVLVPSLMTSRCCRMEAASNTHCSVVEDFLTNPYQVKNQISTYIENLDLDDNNDGANMCVLLLMTIEMKRDRVNLDPTLMMPVVVASYSYCPR